MVRTMIRRSLALLASLAFLATTATAGTKVIYSFAGGDDGSYLDTDLVIDTAGNLYGTTVQGGDFNSGTVFELSPNGSGGWTHTVLYSFTGSADGSEPYKGVTLDPAGNIYGTTVAGGSNSCDGGCGVVFKLALANGSWKETIIHSFTGGTDGSGPGTGLSIDAHGNLYGMTPTGGAYGFGTVFQMRPQSNGAWKLIVLHAFTGGNDGSSASAGRLTFDSIGNLYGVTTAGGANNDGVVFEITRNSAGAWKLLSLYAFKDQPDGALPYGGVIFDKSGNLYGTTYYAGVHDQGTVYKLTRARGAWTESVLYSFKGGTDGSSPISTLVFDKAGNLYGTTSAGGDACNCGVVFKMSPNANSTWTETVSYAFPGVPGAAFAYNGLAADSAGNFYGSTTQGGSSNDGTIYEFTP